MIGWVEFRVNGMLVQAFLGAEGRWACEAAPEIALMLNSECLPAGDPAEDTWGHDALIHAAQRLNGLAWLGPMRPAV